MLEAQGISVETVDLSEVFGRIAKLKDDDAGVQAKLEEIKQVRVHRAASPMPR